MTHARRRRAAGARQALWRVLLALVITVGLGLFYVATLGLPDWLADDLLSSFETQEFAFEARTARFVPLRHLVFTDARLYRKGVVGPPGVEARKLIVDIDPLAFGEKLSRRVRRVAVQHAVCRPRFCFRGDGETPPSSAEAPERAPPPQMDTAFRLAVTHSTIQGLDVQNLVCDVRGRGSVLYFDAARATAGAERQRGRAEGRLTYDTYTHILEGKLETTCDPHLLLPVMDEWDLDVCAALTRDSDFPGPPPRCDVTFRKRCEAGGDFDLSADYWSERAAYRGVSILRADGGVRVATRGEVVVTELDPLLVVREEGILQGRCVFDATNGTAAFSGEATIKPEALLQVIGIYTNTWLINCRTEGASRITGRGVVGFTDPTRTDIRLTARHQKLHLLAYAARDCEYDLRVQGMTNTLTNVQGLLCNGEARGEAQIVLPASPASNVSYAVKGYVHDANFHQISEMFISHTDYERPGRVSVDLHISGLAGDGQGRTVTGDGSVSVKDGRVFSLPVFGPLSQYLTRLIPGLDFVLRQTDATSAFTIRDGRVVTQNASVEGDVLSLRGKGEYFFDNTLDFAVQVKLMKQHTLVAKLLRAITYPLSKLFEFRVRGAASDPAWYPTNFSPDLLERLGLKKTDEEAEESR